ncbi:MAG: hypothetical protein JF604_10185, partial [Bradyrhizobium sp.]|nr:hypothetical protein [Bradyrhizobium sp.]
MSAPSAASAGAPFSFTVTAEDQFGNLDTAYAGTVHFTSTDTGTGVVLPIDYTFVPATDMGTHTFTNGATLVTAGNQTITATDTVSSSISGTSNTINVSAGAASQFAVSAPTSVAAAVPFTFTVTAQDAFHNPVTGYGGTVHFTSTDAAATLPANSTLTNGAGTFTATLRSAGTQAITATDTATAAISGVSNAITVNAASTVLPRNLAIGGETDGSVLLDNPDANGAYSSAATLSPFGSVSVNIRTATGDVNGDGIEDTILITGPGVPTRFAVVSGADNSTLLIPSTVPFAGSSVFTGGGFVSAADFDHDGRWEIVLTPDVTGGPRVVVFSLLPTGLTTRANFFGIDDPNFRGGARTGSGDVNSDGIPDLAVAAGFLGGPRIALFNGATLFTSPTRLINDFFAFPGTDAVNLRNGAYVSIGDVDGDSFGDLIFGAGPGGAPRVFTLSGAQISSGNVF